MESRARAVSYTHLEMADMLMMEYGLDDRGKEVQAKFWGTEEQRKRWLKVKYIKAVSYTHLPPDAGKIE